MGFENLCTISEKWNEDARSVQNFIFWFCVSYKSRELLGRVGRKFPCETPVMESFSFDQTSTMKLFCKNSQQGKVVDYFRKKVTSFWCIIVNFEQISHIVLVLRSVLLWTSKCWLPGRCQFLLKSCELAWMKLPVNLCICWSQDRIIALRFVVT